MFPSAATASPLPFPSSPARPSGALRARLVRGLDLAVEFATLGEYGVEEIEVDAPDPASGWDWPPRCGERMRRPVDERPRPRR